VIARDPGNVLQAVLKGIPMQDGYVPMPSFASQLDDQQIADVANYVRTSWGNAATANATAAEVARLRAQAATK
jgi:mono/diheme cytochrome c family protein